MISNKAKATDENLGEEVRSMSSLETDPSVKDWRVMTSSMSGKFFKLRYSSNFFVDEHLAPFGYHLPPFLDLQ